MNAAEGREKIYTARYEVTYVVTRDFVARDEDEAWKRARAFTETIDADEVAQYGDTDGIDLDEVQESNPAPSRSELDCAIAVN